MSRFRKRFRKLLRGSYLLGKAEWYRRRKKILLLTTPPDYMGNLGDHAQVIGIRKWLKDFFPDYTFVEYDKEEVIRWMSVIARGIQEKDLILLQSGGNLGDLGIWSETARRTAIQALPDNRIVVLPQTVWFTDTEEGRKEWQTTRSIYNQHPNLMVCARDEESLRRARELFPNCQLGLKPDFVLYLYDSLYVQGILAEKVDRNGALLVLRQDPESVLEEEQQKAIENIIRSLSDSYSRYNTVIERDVPREARDDIVGESLRLFARHDIVITDRFHGLIFSVIMRTPCIVLENASHKIAASEGWFKNAAAIRYCKNVDNIENHFAELKGISWEMDSNWIYEEFSELASQIKPLLNAN